MCMYIYSLLFFYFTICMLLLSVFSKFLLSPKQIPCECKRTIKALSDSDYCIILALTVTLTTFAITLNWT